MPVPRLIWDSGTAYDLFLSLMVLHKPAKYGLRGAWAKGVRARLPAPEREVMEQVVPFVKPMRWVHLLPEPKDGATVLQALEEMSPSERFSALAFHPEMPSELLEVYQEVAARRKWGEKDRSKLKAAFRDAKSTPPKEKDLTRVLDLSSRAQELGDRFLEALRTYYEVFFAEEEQRIRPALEKALARAQELAERHDLVALLEELSQGLRLTELPKVPELVLAPSFWVTPLLFFDSVNAERELILFGARPPDASLVPGEVVPDTLTRALKALGDPTRLRILRHLMSEPLTIAQLARCLRLRAPTVVHHLDTLRMAELVHLTLEARAKRRYAARPEAVKVAFAALNAFLEGGDREGLDADNGS